MGFIIQHRDGIIRIEAIPRLTEELPTSQSRNFVVCFLESVLAKFQSCQSSHSEDERKNPKPDDDLVLMPALELKVVVNR